MKIGKPVSGQEIPNLLPSGRKSKYKQIFEAAAKLKDGKWLPVVLEILHQARNLQSMANGNRAGYKFQTRLRGMTLYLRPGL